MSTKMRKIETKTWELAETVDLIHDLLIKEIAFSIHEGNLAFVCDDETYKDLIFLQE